MEIAVRFCFRDCTVTVMVGSWQDDGGGEHWQRQPVVADQRQLMDLAQLQKSWLKS